ncbi:MAG: twin-arginine translocation signal domain-containing protein [Smithellaceae bacterium]
MKKEHNGSRRAFLKNTAVFGGAALSLLLGYGRAPAAPVKSKESSRTPESTGYRLTDHVRKYYETANL